MTYKKLRDSIIVRAKYEALKRNLPYVNLPDAVIYDWIAKAEGDIQTRIMPLTTLKSVTIGYEEAEVYANEEGIPYVNHEGLYYISSPAQYIFGLPENFGKEISLSIEGTELDYLPLAEFNNLVKNGRTANQYTRYFNGESELIKLSLDVNQTYELKLFYHDSILPFSESGKTENSEIQLPVRYYSLIEKGVLSNMFNEYYELYEIELRRQNAYENSTKKETIEGDNLGGISL